MASINIPRHLLLQIDKPARYLGGEWGSVSKKLTQNLTRMVLCFPDIYDIGMSHLGMKILYHMVNEREDSFCERSFMPWTDMKALMEENKIPLFSLETKSSLDIFDIVGFTLQYEMSYTNVLHMLKMGGIPLFSKDRTQEDPLVIAGGPCTYNPEPLAPFVDCFFIGESEEQLTAFLDLYRVMKDGEGYCKEGFSKESFLYEASKKIGGLYVPAFYDVSYKEDGTIEAISPNKEGLSQTIRKALIKDPDKSYFPTKIIVPYIQTVHDRVSVELFRGCIRGCRFCQAGYVTRPVRNKGNEKLADEAMESLAFTGYDELGLLSLSTGDYPELKDLTHSLEDKLEDSQVKVSLPSLRLDSFNDNVLSESSVFSKGGLTFAPEAGSQRLRDVINKNITQEDLISSAGIAFNAGISRLKLYFMLGLPTETDEDVLGIPDLAFQLVRLYKGYREYTRNKKLQITISTAMFIPKPFTAFQWEGQDTYEDMDRKTMLIRQALTRSSIKFNWHDFDASVWEAVLARGDRRIAEVIYRAFLKGQSFDSWEEHFKLDAYKELMQEAGLDIGFYANRKRPYDELLPWDHIDCGVTKKYLIRESRRAEEGLVTPDCVSNCSGCGATVFSTGVCFE